MDSTFVKYIEEIEKLYIHLPKSQRVRIEKWVEKLVSIGSNVVWRKHRNAYTKLLLNMVISKNISEPFNSLPPEGPLPSYPFHIKPITKDLVGVHETTFWRDLYKRLQEQDTKEHISLSHLQDRSYHSGLPQSKSSPFGSNPLSREIDNLQILIKEQEQKILLLEQQLHEDRVKHELQIQRINYSHRMEIHQLLQNTQSNNDGSQAPLSSHKLPSFLSHREVFPDKDFSLNRTSFGQVSINRSSSPTFESSNALSKDKRISPKSYNTHINSAVTQNQWNQYDYNSNRLYQSYPSSNQTQPTEFESTRKFSGLEGISERNYQPDFTATLLRDHPPIIPVPNTMRDDSMNTSQVPFITNKQLFDNSRSIIDSHDISVSAPIPNSDNPEEFIRKDHSLSPIPVPDIIPSRKPSMTENSSMSSVEPNITHIPVHKQSQPLPNSVPYGNAMIGTGIAEIFSSQNNQFLHEVRPEVEEDDEGDYELRGEEKGGLLEKDSSDEDFLNYLDKFQQQISIINVDS